MSLIELPQPIKSNFSLDKAILQRRSVRQFNVEPLTIQQLSNLLWTASGVTGYLPEASLRTAPSAGATYPIEVYALINNVIGLDSGVYHYLADTHHLKLIKYTTATSIVNSVLRQRFILRAGITFILTAMPSRTIRRYGNRAWRYIYMEAGHIAQNIMLESVALGLSSVPVGAFDDEKINEYLGFIGTEQVAVYLVSVGKQRG